MNKKELIDAIASGSKLTKADAGRLVNQVNNFADDMISEYGLTHATASKIIKQILVAKLTKADAGRTDATNAKR
jgi:hypothetical protein